MTPELLFAPRSQLAEGPLWHADRLWWVDILTGTLHTGDPSNGEAIDHSTGLSVLGAAAPTERGDWLLAGPDAIYRWTPTEDTPPRLLAAPRDHSPSFRFNDAKVDPSGRYWAGTMNRDGIAGQGALFTLESEGEAPRLVARRKPVDLANGMAWDATRRLFYFIDSPTRTVSVSPWDPNTGTLGPAEIAIDLTSESGQPDGMCIDLAGDLWVAMWEGSQLLRIDPRVGRVADRIRFPVTRVTSCCFGGPDFGTLYITTARAWLSPSEQAKQPHAGGIFQLSPGVSGPPLTLFAG